MNNRRKQRCEWTYFQSEERGIHDNIEDRERIE